MANTGAKTSKLNSRISEIRSYFCDGNNEKFASKIGVNKSYCSGLCAGSKNAGEESINKILEAFPDVSRSWLYFGEGPMLNAERSNSEGRAKEERNAGNSVTQINHSGNNNSTIGGYRTDELREVIRSKDETIQKMGDTIAVLTAEVEQLRNYVSLTSNKYINIIERMMFTVTETNEAVKECRTKIGFKKD